MIADRAESPMPVVIEPSQQPLASASHCKPFPLRDGPPTLRDGPPTLRDGPPTLRDGPPTLRDGPPTLRDGPPTASPLHRGMVSEAGTEMVS